MIATKKLQNNKVEYIASAITVKLQNRVYILFSGYNPQYKNVSANYFLHFKLIEYYKYQYLYLDLNGISGVNEKDNPYYGLDQFKLGFKPRVLQTIGEYDLIINKFEYQKLAKKGYLDKEFKRQIKSE
jgi:lipid II:glycine glycyltransferase (peptidoglycan interpeptide bridge formation enzyme)